MSYLKESRDAVLKAIRQMNGWYTAGQVRRYMKDNPSHDNLPTTKLKGNKFRRSSGGWRVIDFVDRIKRALEYWVKENKVKHKEEYGVNFYKAN